MLVRVLIGLSLACVAVGIAFVLERRRAEHNPNTPVRDAHPVPKQLHRADFPQPDARWLVVLFSSLTCDSCASMREKVFALESPEVAVCDLEYSVERTLHDRYEITGVPMVLVADAEGVVVESFVGPVSATDLWAAVARVRE